MKKTIDCLFIGHNEMNFAEYEKTVRQMGTNSTAYRDLNLNFIRYNKKPYTVSETLNLFCLNERSVHTEPVRMLETFSSAIAYLGTYLHRRGYTFDYVNSFQDEKEELKKKLLKENILTVAVITTLYITAFPIIEIVDFVRKYNTAAKIVIGGPFISNKVRTLGPAQLEYLFKNTIEADFCVFSSQGEATLVNIIDALKNDLPLGQINNIYYKTGNGLTSTPILIENNKLSENMVDWDLFAGKVGKHIAIRTSISCPFSCAFCGSPEHAGKYQTVDVGVIEKEFNRLNNIDSLQSVHIVDDTYNVPVKRFKEILRMMIKNKYKFKWHSHFRCQFADREMVELMKESGCMGVFLGIESGSDRILKNMNKAASVEKYRHGISLLKENEIVTYGSFILGFPGETAETVRETIRFIRETGIDFYRAQVWYCDPITPIWQQRDKYDLKGSNFEWKHKTMDSKTASDWVDRIFLTIDKSIWVPYHHFDFDNLWHLLHHGLSMEEIKDFLKSFNDCLKEKLLTPSLEEVSYESISKMKVACLQDNFLDVEGGVIDRSEADFEF
jgi:radical SAM PhpK family P-methyltransferase